MRRVNFICLILKIKFIVKIFDIIGFILVADSGNSRIQVIRPDGSFVCEFGSSGTESGKFKGLEGLTITSTGDVVVCDKENHRIQIL